MPPRLQPLPDHVVTTAADVHSDVLLSRAGRLHFIERVCVRWAPDRRTARLQASCACGNFVLGDLAPVTGVYPLCQVCVASTLHRDPLLEKASA